MFVIRTAGHQILYRLDHSLRLVLILDIQAATGSAD